MGREGGDRSRSKGRGRGRGKLFIANIEEMQVRDEQVATIKQNRAARRGESDDEEDKVEEFVGDIDESKIKELADFERATRLEQKKVQDNADEENDDRPRGLLSGMEIANPNKSNNQNKMMKNKDIKDMDGAVEEPQLSRREREAIEAQRKAADYARRHAAGETQAAKEDLARLEEVKRRREASRIAREAEGRKPGWTQNGVESSSDEDSDDDGVKIPKKSVAPVTATAAPPESALAAKKRAAAAAPSEAESSGVSGELEKLKAMDIKKMNADVLKAHLKARNLDIQGQKKDLIKRLCDFEAARE